MNIYPTIHLNGSSADSLLEANLAAVEALRNAYSKLCEAEPNARDYYVQGDQAFKKARTEFQFRLHYVKSAMDETYAIVESIQNQIDGLP